MGQLQSTCPQASEITDQVDYTCGFDIGQILKFVAQRQFSSGTTLNSITPANIVLLASWTTLLGATNGTKVQASPNLMGDADTAPGGPISFGSGNAVPYGIPILVGTEPTPFTAKLYNPQPKSILALKGLYGEVLGVYLINNYGKIVCKVDNPTTPTVCYPIPIISYWIGDRDAGGITDPDFQEVRWSFLPNWSDKIAAFTPTDFDALTQITGS